VTGSLLTIEDEWIAVRSASVAARGVLADLLYLIEREKNSGAVLYCDVLLRMIGVSGAELEAYVAELVELIVSDRMARHQRIRNVLAENGRKGGRPRKQSETNLVNPESKPRK
jgi:hypothetical protein